MLFLALWMHLDVFTFLSNFLGEFRNLLYFSQSTTIHILTLIEFGLFFASISFVIMHFCPFFLQYTCFRANWVIYKIIQTLDSYLSIVTMCRIFFYTSSLYLVNLLHFIHNISSIHSKNFKKRSEVLYHLPLTFYQRIILELSHTTLVVTVLLDHRNFTFQWILLIYFRANSYLHEETHKHNWIMSPGPYIRTYTLRYKRQHQQNLIVSV